MLTFVLWLLVLVFVLLVCNILCEVRNACYNHDNIIYLYWTWRAISFSILVIYVICLYLPFVLPYLCMTYHLGKQD